MIVKEEKKIWKKALIKNGASIKKAIQNLNNSSLQIVIVLSKKKKFIGTITDGDIRRGLLKGLNVNNSINNIVNTNSLFVNEKAEINKVKKIIYKNDIRHLPIVNKNNVLKGLYVFNKYLQTSKENTPIIIMAGGKGTRLLPITSNCPKPLVKVQGKPILEHIILKAKNEGFSTFYISIHYLGHKIKNYFLDGKKWNVKIRYLKENRPLGTAGSLNLAKRFIKTNFLVVNGDILSVVKFSNLLAFHNYHKALGTMAVRNHEIQHPFGVVSTRGIRIKNFEEKPIIKTYVNAGVYAFSPKIFKLLKKNKKFNMPEVFETLKRKNKKIIVFPIHETWFDVGEKNELMNVEKFGLI